MFNKKKGLLILLLLIVSICAISSVSASDNATDAISADDVSEDAVTNVDEDIYETGADESLAAEENSEVLASGDEPVISQDQTSNPVSGLPVESWKYTVKIQDNNKISATGGGKFNYYLKPYNMFYTDAYNFKFVFLDVHGTKVYETQYFQGEQGSISEGNYYITLGKNVFKPGLYIVGAYNKADGNLMSANTLQVSGTAKITASDFNGVYNTGTMTARVTDSKGKPLTSMGLNVVYKKGSTEVKESYITDSNGYVSFTPVVGAGTWSVTFTSQLSYVTATAVTKTAVIGKAPVSIQAFKVTEYKGHKTTIKAKVTSNGKDVNEGTVTFKINGKKYTVAVKNGWATKSVKLTKIKTYKYSAKFNGNGNLYASNSAKSKAVLKKSFKTKIITKNYALYTFKEKTVTIKVKTTSGKNVKGGQLKITGAGLTHYVAVKNGKAKVVVKGLHALKHFVGFKNGGETYKKSITQKHKIKYIPDSHKYKSSGKTMKVTSKFKCPLCGKTKTHAHQVRGYYYTYRGSLIRIV